jgi:hypothetical protein
LLQDSFSLWMLPQKCTLKQNLRQRDGPRELADLLSAIAARSWTSQELSRGRRW